MANVEADAALATPDGLLDDRAVLVQDAARLPMEGVRDDVPGVEQVDDLSQCRGIVAHMDHKRDLELMGGLRRHGDRRKALVAHDACTRTGLQAHDVIRMRPRTRHRRGDVDLRRVVELVPPDKALARYVQKREYLGLGGIDIV